jgi:hypothetical protein
MATFYRRLQTNPVIRGIRISLVDLITTVAFSTCAWIGSSKFLELYEIDYTGITLIPFGVTLFIFIKVCKWFQKEGDGVLKKDGRFRYLSSHKINRILTPDALNAEELFIVVHDIFQTSQQSWFASIFARLTGNINLKQRDISVQRVTGTNFCFNLKRSN